MSFPQRRGILRTTEAVREPAACRGQCIGELGDLQNSINVDQLLLPGVTKAAD